MKIQMPETEMGEPDKAMLEAAYRWQSKIVGGELDEQGQRALGLWLDADARHVSALKRADRLWADIGTLDSAAFASELTSQAEAEQIVVPIRRQSSSDSRRSPRRRLTIASVGCGVAAVIAWVVLFVLPPSTPHTIDYRTGIAEQLRVPMADGSEITLGAQTQLRVTMSEQARRVALSAGDAFFDVASQDTRPFIVEAGNTTVRVVGTEFSVRQRTQSTRIAVAEGEVEVALDRPEASVAAPPAYQLSAGAQLEAVVGAKSAALSTVPVANIGAWRRGELVFIDAPLTDILQEANRYYSDPIVVGDPALSQLRLSAVFDADDVEGMLITLKESLPIRVSHWQDGTVFVTTRLDTSE